jgi:glycosyltransferase involved in cell wall biosynthesis
MDSHSNACDCREAQSEELSLKLVGSPVISVVVAARNEFALIGRCLTALAQQTFPRTYEVIVVDNASTDSTATIAHKFGCRIVEESIPGQLRAKHRGVLAARGEIVAVIDADCVPPSHWLSSIYNSLATGATQKVVAVTARYRYEPGMPWWGAVYTALMQLLLVETPRLFRNTMSFVIGGNVAFRRECYEICGGYPQHGGLAETELGLARNLNKCGLVKYVDAMEVTSSPRRFQDGAITFFFRYKLRAYFDRGRSIAID